MREKSKTSKFANRRSGCSRREGGKLGVVVSPHKQKILIVKAEKLEKVCFETKFNLLGISSVAMRDSAVVLSPHNIERVWDDGRIRVVSSFQLALYGDRKLNILFFTAIEAREDVEN
jgi:hypothetical protein